MSAGFTGIDASAADLRGPRKLLSGTYPETWLRHQFSVPHSRNPTLKRLDRWIERKLTGRWGSYTVTLPEAAEFIVLFELAGDLMLFRGAEHEFMKPEEAW